MVVNLDYSGKCIGRKYHLLSRLGNGCFGVVYKARDVILNVEKALKIIEFEDVYQLSKLFNEASIPYKCKGHNNIVQINNGEIIYCDFLRSYVFVIDMELVDGKSVEDLLRSSATSVVWSITVIKQILFAVEFSHLQGNIHRDIKPANILIDNQGVAKLSDFGLATAFGDVVTPPVWYESHCAPEAFLNSVATVETDIYAVGMTLYRMVNGISDWQLFLSNIPNVDLTIREGQLIDTLGFLPFVPDKVCRIIRKACNRNPNLRYSSAGDMRNALEKLSLLYSWRLLSKDHWVGEANGLPNKDVYLDYKKDCIEVIVKNNNRRSSSDSKSFQMYEDATSYMYSYVKNNTVD